MPFYFAGINKKGCEEELGCLTAFGFWPLPSDHIKAQFTTHVYVFFISICGFYTAAAIPQHGLNVGFQEWNSDEYPCEDWSKELVDDNIAAIDLTKELQSLTKEDFEQLYCSYVEGIDEEAPSAESPRRNKRSLKSLLSSLKGKIKDGIFKQVIKFVKQKQDHPRCYASVGCFYAAENMSVEVGGPASPEAVGTKIMLFTGSSGSGIQVKHTDWKNIFQINPVNLSKPLVVVTHGFTKDNDMSWMHNLKEAFFEHMDCNVMLVEWIKGAKFPNYAAAAANSPMPGVLISLLLQEMKKPNQGNLSAENVHLIGFSLGAHAVGFGARHFYNATRRKIGRITGLDPAGPLFEGTTVSLSQTDAVFVDVLHTHSGTLKKYKLGIKDAIGHVDFFPNGGSTQPGCESVFKFGCSHKRAQVYFTESISRTSCQFKSYSCQGGWENHKYCETTKDPLLFGEMGYHSISRKGRGEQYLSTNNKAPYCIG